MKTVTLGSRIESFEKRAFIRAARSSNLSMSVWMRTRLRWAAIKDLPELRSILDPAVTRELVAVGRAKTFNRSVSVKRAPRAPRT
jgi:hypothetical protein